MSNRTFLKRKLIDFNIFFCFLSNSIVVNRSLVWNRYTFPLTTFCLLKSNIGKGCSFLFKFFDVGTKFWVAFWQLVSMQKALVGGFFVEMELLGLGFRIRKIIPNLYRFFWGHANFLYLFVPRDVYVEYASEGRTIFFFSYSASSIYNFATYLMLLKRMSAYRVTGFIRPGKIIRLNSGKQR